jgi:hypothetical protein
MRFGARTKVISTERGLWMSMATQLQILEQTHSTTYVQISYMIPHFHGMGYALPAMVTMETRADLTRFKAVVEQTLRLPFFTSKLLLALHQAVLAFMSDPVENRRCPCSFNAACALAIKICWTPDNVRNTRKYE